MDFLVPTAQDHANRLGFDGISMYALPGGTVDVCIFIFSKINMFVSYLQGFAVLRSG